MEGKRKKLTLRPDCLISLRIAETSGWYEQTEGLISASVSCSSCEPFDALLNALNSDLDDDGDSTDDACRCLRLSSDAGLEKACSLVDALDAVARAAVLQAE